MISPPIYYDHANAITSYNRPGTVHTKNNALYGFFQRYLLQRDLFGNGKGSRKAQCQYGSKRKQLFHSVVPPHRIK